MEGKVVDFKIEDGFLVLTVDPNKNGIVLLTLKLNLAEVPAEVLALFSKKE